MLHVACCLWATNEKTNPACGFYSDEWVPRLYRSFKRHLTVPFRFVVFVDRERDFGEGIEQERLITKKPDYGALTEPYRLNEPMIVCGLDTIVVGNIDHMAEWCLTGDRIALPRDPKSYSLKDKGYPDQGINGVAFVPRGWRRVFDEWRGENDMHHIRKYPWVCTDDKWPGHVVSYKLRVRPDGEKLGDARIVYFHGQPKADTLGHIDWIKENWK